MWEQPWLSLTQNGIFSKPQVSSHWGVSLHRILLLFLPTGTPRRVGLIASDCTQASKLDSDVVGCSILLFITPSSAQSACSVKRVLREGLLLRGIAGAFPEHSLIVRGFLHHQPFHTTGSCPCFGRYSTMTCWKAVIAVRRDGCPVLCSLN